ncbi:hypothetical protein BCR44DRAFT_1432921 [Catenaria anguillulae PL171]|uniref:VWFD domain-containing protein n=1 Tax=Catenaria anguillulae PL171 TaxID=765915 RepID=A0A1Y2HNJ3_9FUNG|nr:hypothetical protein BCR44DRAFT_1432921 [Catenaria anguillulae PL171]
MKVDIYGAGDARYMNVLIDVANHLKGKVNGLCGKFDGIAANDFTSPDGQTTFPANEIIAQSAADMFGQSPNYPKTPLFFYGESWRVPETENLFTCRDQCPGLTGMKAPLPAPVAECKIPTTVPKCEPKQPQLPQDPIEQKPIQTVSSSTSTAASTSSDAKSTTTAASQTSTATSATHTQGQATTTSSTAAAAPTSTTAVAATTKTADQTSSTAPAVSTSGSSTSTTSNTVNPSSTTTTTTNAQPQPTQAQPQQPQPGKPHRPIHVKPRKPICPRPIIVIPIPPGYRRQVQLPRYKQQPRPPVYRPLPQPPQKVIDDAKRGCARKIVRIDQCTVDVSRFIRACEADVAAQVNPEIVFDMHNDAYTDLCAKQIVDKAREPFPDVAKRAMEALKKHCFGNAPCDNQCLQCSTRGCLECKDRSRFEVQGGRCVPRKSPPVQYDQKYFSQRPKYRALTDGDIVGAPQVDAAENVDPTFNPEAVIETTSVSVAMSEDPVKAAEANAEKAGETNAVTTSEDAAPGQGEKSSAASRVALSSVAGAVALVASLLL